MIPLLALIPMQMKLIIVGVLLAVVAAAIAGGYLKGRSDGKAVTEAGWQKREAQINADTARKILDNAETVRAEERTRAERQAKVSADFQQKLQETTNAKDRVIADLRTGARRLSIAAICAPSGGNAVPGATAPTVGRNGETRAELSESAGRFLVELASEADAVVAQLTACQALITADRKGVKP